jgi:hypothetical protein
MNGTSALSTVDFPALPKGFSLSGLEEIGFIGESGEPCRTRTYNLEIKSLLLYQLS